ncbi:MAG: MoaD/ThiS family protein [Proteobacteria bacterium]|nr:MoaD/ThiS family protein [Pseudomonadota bacterium]
MINLEILFFGKLKETWNTNKLSIQTTSSNVEELYTELLTQASEAPHKASIKVAINDEFVNWDSQLNDNDIVAFLPPASGG